MPINTAKRKDVLTMNLTEFMNSGLLQEINRRILHPMGLALYLTVKDGIPIGIGGVLDHRDDPAGMVFPDMGEEHYKRYKNVQDELDRRIKTRSSVLGFGVQPVPGDDYRDEAKQENGDEEIQISTG